MINPFVAIDTLLLDGVAQRIADWVQVRWSRTCFWLEKQGLNASIGLFALWAILDGIERPMENGVAVVSAIKIVVFLVLIAFKPTLFRRIDEQEQEIINSRMVNPRRVRGMFSRLNMVFITAVCTIVYVAGPDANLDDYTFCLFLMTLLAVGYFAACTPRPPVREAKYPSGILAAPP